MEPPEGNPKAHLVLTMHGGEKINIPVWTSPFTIGRAKSCDHVIDNKIISGTHCRIHHDEENGIFLLEDTSTNGMLINRTVRTSKGQKFPLKDGDEVFLVYRKVMQGQKYVISFRFEEVKKLDEESDALDRTSPYEEEESTQEYHYFKDEDITHQEEEKKRKRDNEEAPPVQEAKKIHLTPGEPLSVSSSVNVSGGDQKEGEEKQKMMELNTPYGGEPSRDTDKGGGQDSSTAEKTEKDKAEVVQESQDEMMETLVCSICQDILHDCVSLQPCMHTFCASCYSQWMTKSGKCPTCRKRVKRISKNHIVNNLVEAYLKVNPDKRRSEEDIAEMNAKNKITSDTIINPGQHLDDDSFSDDSEDELNSSSEIDNDPVMITNAAPFWNLFGSHQPAYFPPPPIMTCRQCPGHSTNTSIPSCTTGCQPQASTSSITQASSTAQPSASCSSSSEGTTSTSGQNFRITAGNVRVPLPTPPPFVCPPQANHLMCRCCQERFPDRRNQASQSNIPPISCSMCHMFYCHMYWGCTKNAGCFGCLSKFKDLNFGDKCTDLLILGNSQESSIFKKYLQQKNLTWKSVLDESLEKLDQGEFQSLLASTSAITKESIICYSCGLKVFKELAYQYRENIPRDQLPAEAISRPDCYWGKNCRTQFNKPLHAVRFNHICNQTRF